MEKNQNSTKEYFKLISIIHTALVLGVILFGAIVCLFIVDFQHVDSQSVLANLFVYLVPGLIMAGIIASNVIFRIKLNNLLNSEELIVKMEVYRRASIIRSAFIQLPALFALMVIFMTSDINYLVYAGLMIILLIIKRPTLKLAISELRLDQKEIALLENPDSKVF
jgi:hypothetical protein